MARNIGADGRKVFRAVIRFGDSPARRYEGPYATPGAARGRVAFWRNRGSATGHIEQAHTVWTPVDGEAEPEQYKPDPYGRPTWASADPDGDRLLIAPAVIPGQGAGIYFRTDHTGSSIPLADLPALIARLQTLADTAEAEAAAAKESDQ